MTLCDFANQSKYPVLFWAGVGQPLGEETPLCYPDLDFADRRNLNDLTGEIDSDGVWRWDGDGNPTDDRGNTITQLSASDNERAWERIVREYEEAY